MKVYLVTNEWATEDSCGTEIEVCGDYDKAKLIIAQWIAKEKNECWDQAFDEDGNIMDGYRYSEGEEFFEIFEDGYYTCSHSIIRIQVKEVQ